MSHLLSFSLLSLLIYFYIASASELRMNFSSNPCAPYSNVNGFCWSSLGRCYRYYDPSTLTGMDDAEIDAYAKQYYNYLVSQTQWTPYDCDNVPANATPCVHDLPGYVETKNQQKCLDELQLIACYAYIVNCQDDNNWGQPLCAQECPPFTDYMTSSWSFRSAYPCLQYYGNLVQIWAPSYWDNLCDPTQWPNGTSWNNLAGQNDSCINVCFSCAPPSGRGGSGALILAFTFFVMLFVI